MKTIPAGFLRPGDPDLGAPDVLHLEFEWINGLRVVLKRTEQGWTASALDAPNVCATGATRECVTEAVQSLLAERPAPNPYLAVAGTFADDPFADDVDAFSAAERQRERDAIVQAQSGLPLPEGLRKLSCAYKASRRVGPEGGVNSDVLVRDCARQARGV